MKIKIKQGAVKEASTAYKQMMRGRYEYLNDFMEEMQVRERERERVRVMRTHARESE